MKKIFITGCIIGLSLTFLSGCETIKKGYDIAKKHCTVDVVTKKVTCKAKW